MMFKRLILLMSLLLNSCAFYEFKHGDCQLKIWSMREIRAGDLRISKNCALTGGAEQLNYNEQQMMIMQKMVEKIP